MFSQPRERPGAKDGAGKTHPSHLRARGTRPPPHPGSPRAGLGTPWAMPPPWVGRGSGIWGVSRPLRLTRYLFSPICSTWNLLAHLHWATCLVTCHHQHER